MFFAALVVDFSTAAISSIAQPSQWRITNAVRSEELNSFNASSIFFLSSMFPATRSGVGLSSATKSSGSCSCSSAKALGVCRRESSVRLLPHAVNRVIRRDAISPGAEIGARSELAKILVGAQKSFLHHFLGVVLISCHAIRQAKELLAVALDQHPESIALARERALHGDGIAFSGRVLECLAVLGASSAFVHPNH